MVLALFAPWPLYAQQDTGSIDGRVLDEQKAAMPGVTITAKNVATGLTRSVQSSTSGTYHIGSLPAGTYDITAEITGFSTMLRKDVVVPVATTISVDFALRVGNLSETVTVTGEAPLVQTTRSDIGQVITTQMVESMPLNGRKFQDLSLLVPGTRPANYYDPTKTEVGGISYGGLTGRSVIINVDGGDNNDGVVRGILQQFSEDAIQEYKVTTQRYSAEFGRSVGGVVNVITKSGTNVMSGSAFLFARNEKLNSTGYFEKLAIEDGSQKEKSPFRQEQFGGTFGGPIIKDKAHYFFSYEYNDRQDYANVYTGGRLPNEEGAFAKPFRNHLLTTKADFQLTPNSTLIARYALEDQKRQHDFIGGNTLASAGALNTNVIHSFIAKNTTVLGNSKLNEALFLFQRFENNITADDNTKPEIDTPDFIYGANANTPQQTIQRRIQVKDDFSFRKENAWGDHDFKAGGEIINSFYGGFFIPTFYGEFVFNDALPTLNDYLNTKADSFIGSAGTNAADDHWTYVAAYFQDDWKPMNNLTLNLGLRWEQQRGPYSNDFQTVPLQQLQTLGFNTTRHTPTKDFGPRIGFAWDVKGDAKTVVRGGVGRYYDELFQNITLYERWSDIRTPLYFISEGVDFTPAQYMANRDAIRNSFIDPTFAGQRMRMTANDLQQPYSWHTNVGFSHRVTRDFSFDVDYIHSIGKQEVHRWYINTAQTILPDGRILPGNQNTRLSPAERFYPTTGRWYVEGNRGHSQFDGLYLTGKVRATNLAEVIASYALTRGMNIANDFGSYPSIPDNLHWEDDWGYMPNDMRHRFTTGAVFQLPHGIQYSTAVQANSGKPWNALAGFSGVVGNLRAEGHDRNDMRAGGFFSWDMRFAKIFKLPAARQSMEVLFEVFNITDHVNYDVDNYITSIKSGSFGSPTNILLNSNRQAEFGVRFKF
jgi:outer membrane receptor protein involved in Fe transport